MLRFMTAGESHGKCLTGILEGLPAGLVVDKGFIDMQLQRRQIGYGRGARMKIEKDEIDITAGVRFGRTLGSPVCFVIHNRDWQNWEKIMSSSPVIEGADKRAVTRPRPGHVDLPGALKYHTYDARDVLERASARETAARVSGGALCQLFLKSFGIRIGSHVIAVGSERVSEEFEGLDAQRILEIDPLSVLRCADSAAGERMKSLIDGAKQDGDTLGGLIEVVACGVPPGLGTHTQWDRRLDGRLAQAMMSIPAAKGVEIGEGVVSASRPGSAVHDEIFYDHEGRRFYRNTNRAGGVEAGITNGSDIRVRVHMKPVPTLRKALMSVDLRTKEAFKAQFERSDTCVVPAAAVIAEAMLAIVLTEAFLEKFGGDTIEEAGASFSACRKALAEY